MIKIGKLICCSVNEMNKNRFKHDLLVLGAVFVCSVHGMNR